MRNNQRTDCVVQKNPYCHPKPCPFSGTSFPLCLFSVQREVLKALVNTHTLQIKKKSLRSLVPQHVVQYDCLLIKINCMSHLVCVQGYKWLEFV